VAGTLWCRRRAQRLHNVWSLQQPLELFSLAVTGVGRPAAFGRLAGGVAQASGLCAPPAGDAATTFPDVRLEAAFTLYYSARGRRTALATSVVAFVLWSTAVLRVLVAALSQLSLTPRRVRPPLLVVS